MEETHFISLESNQRESSAIMWSNQIQSLNPEEFMHLLSQLEDMWDINTTNNSMISFQLGYKNFINPQDLDPETGVPVRFDVELVSGNHKRLKMQLGQMYHRAEVLKLLDIEDDDDMKISMRINRLIDQVDDAWQIIFRVARIRERINNPTYVPINPESDPSIFRCSTMDKIEELAPYQQAILACLQNLYETNVKRYKGYCCRQIKTEDGHDTRAWKQVETIQDYVYGVAQKETQYEIWKNLSSRGSAYNDVIRHLTNCKDMQFHEIIKNRHVWSFKNGIFIGKEWSAQTGLYESNFYTYESREFKNLDQTIVSCKYFDKEFTTYEHLENWYDIPTPFFQSILEYQKFDSDVSKWMYVMGGRLCFGVNDIDTWQVIPFLKGIARSGKSTLITKVFRKFYEVDDIRTLSNNVEKKFGLSSIHDALMYIAPEIKGDLQLEQAEFQSIISGEEVSIAVKCEKAKNFVWKVPGILGGNEVPQWKDKSGSILRRLVTFHFGKQVRDSDTDPTLDSKLETEMPKFIQKCLRGYLEYAQKYHDQDIWNVLPSYFFKVREQIAAATNPLEKYLQRDDLIITNPNVKFPLDLFRSKLKD